HHVDADPARLQQMFWNLIKNAVKFTPRCGLIAVQSWTEVGSQGTRLAVAVRDTGIGIGPEVLPKIFDAFEQGDPAVTRKFGGRGLGRAISRSLAEAHGGHLSVQSRGQSQGATFTLRLPVVPAPAPAPAPEAPTESESLTALRILLVEDNADTLRILAR